MGEFRMPSLGADMEAAILRTWRVNPGQKVRCGDILAEVETDKGLIEIEVFEDGTVDRILAAPGNKLPVGTVLATIAAGATGPVAPLPAGTPPPAPPPPGEERVRISPVARKRAAEAGVDLDRVKGTGPGGTIQVADVERAAAEGAGKVISPKEEAVSMALRHRRAIAAAMARSNREIPHYYLQTRIDISRGLAWLKEHNAQRPMEERLLPAVLLTKAVALALKQTPELNGFWLEERLVQKQAVHIGFAIALREGALIAPAVHDVDTKSLDQLRVALSDLIARARAGRLRSSELSDATITVTNLGDLGVETLFGVIYPPQVALVGFGRIREQPWSENGMLGVRPVLVATLAADHRATDGLRGAQFLGALERCLNAPETL
jgi:pyruvate dehydrogenase E2 component (dihydrolipoamide acetyltransferase)